MTGFTAAVVGCGWVGVGASMDILRLHPATHADALVDHPDVDLVALVDPDPEARTQANKQHPKVATFPDVQSMLQAQVPDIVVVATDPDNHANIVVTCAESGVKAILCEKPLAHDRTEAESAVHACDEHGTLLFVNHMRRFDPDLRRLREHLVGGYVQDTAIGTIRLVVGHYDKGLYHGGTHMVDLMQYFLGDPVWVSAVHVDDADATGDPRVNATMRFANATASLLYFDSGNFALSDMNLIGERGRVDLYDMCGLRIEARGTKDSPHYSAYREIDLDHPTRIGEARSWFAAAIPHIVDCLNGDDSPVASGKDALRSLDVLHAIHQSADANGAIVPFDGPLP